MFAYCGNNPINAVEIDGYFFAPVGYILVQGAISGLVNFAIEYFFISGSFKESAKSFGKGFLEGVASSAFSSKKIQSVINCAMSLYSIYSVSKNCKEAGATGKETLLAASLTIFGCLLPGVDFAEFQMTYEMFISYLLVGFGVDFAPSLISSLAEENTCNAAEMRYSAAGNQSSTCTSSVLGSADTRGGGSPRNGVRAYYCIF